ncbi:MULTISPECIES: YHS domain-containing protein [Caldisericum]|jgi:YHS domain-containing protein|uniref:YHS domain-containing protein n=1 Tax=Caldisericum exile TaxID=693075 RepID=A0A2J6X9D5_9BACT|nr:MAG: YHS domain-containing protein [Caldisericum exile]PMP83995.1 MAG: YHS domain-containing protein [Caldisericum exile]
MVQDPVCKMIMEKIEALTRVEYNGEIYYFCSEDCKEQFLKNPEKYLIKPKKPENSGC